MKGRGNDTHDTCDRRGGKVRMTLQANEADLLADQHAWIHRPMRLMTTATAFKAHWCVFKRERSTFVAMASHATAIVGSVGLGRRLGGGSVRVVTIHAGHSPFGHLVMVRFLERRPHVHVAGRALFIDPNRRPRHQSLSAVCVYGVAADAGNFVARVARLNPSHVCGLIQMASEAHFVGGDRGDFCWIANILRRKRLSVLLRGPMTRFAGFIGPAAFLIGVNNAMGTLLERVIEVLVASLASLGTHVRRRDILRRHTCDSRSHGAYPKDKRPGDRRQKY